MVVWVKSLVQKLSETLLRVNSVHKRLSAWQSGPTVQIEFKKLVHLSKFSKPDKSMSFVNSLGKRFFSHLAVLLGNAEAARQTTFG